MAEPFAAGVLNSLLQPRGPQLGSLARAVRATSLSPGVPAAFFTPAPRQGKQRAHGPAPSASVGQHILDCQAWACSPSKQELWGHDGSMRTALMGEIAPTETRGRVRRTSKSSRDRFRHNLAAEPSRQYHVSSPHSGQPARDYSWNAASPPSLPSRTPAIASTYVSPSRKQPSNEFKELLNANRFAELQEAALFHQMPSQELLDIAEALANNADRLCMDKCKEDVQDWGQKIMYLMELVETNASTSTSPPDQQRVQSLSARAYAFMGDIDEAEIYLSDRAETDGRRYVPSQNYIESSHFHRVLTSILLSLYIHQSWEEAIIYLFDVSYLRWKSSKLGASKFLVDAKLGELLGFFQVPVLLKHIADWDPSRRQELRDFILTALNGIGHYAKAYEFINVLHRMELECPPTLVSESIKGLLSRHDILNHEKKARTLFQFLPSNSPDHETLRRLVQNKPPAKSATAGKDSLAQTLIAEARSVFDKFPPKKPPAVNNPSVKEDRSTMADKPPISTVLPPPPGKRAPLPMAAFNVRYPIGPDGIRTPHPDLNVYFPLMRALRDAGDHRSAIELWEDMKSQSVQPDMIFLCLVLGSYRALWDSKGALNLFTYLKEHNLAGDNVFYTMLIRHFTSRMDLNAAEQVYQHAIAHGVIPDLDTKLSLLTAHFKCGAWKKGINLFTELKTSGVKLTTAAYNAVLEGCIFIGAPFKTVLRLFARLEMEGITPDKYTYAILMHHAMIGGHWAFAQSLYQDLLRMDKDRPKYSRNVDMALISTMIRGFLRGNRQKEARDMIKEMKRLKLQHTAITHATIARAYVMSGSEEDIALAEEYIRDVVADTRNRSWRTHDVRRLRKDPLAMMYAPLLSARTELGDVAGVERLMGAFFAAGGTPSIGILRHLLKAYGEADQMDNMRYVWARILALAVEPKTGAGAAVATGMRNISAVVDIYTRIMSQRGHHAELARAWGALMDAGNEFDEDNWNSYVFACLRAGQIARAFEVIERILQPNFNAGLRNHFSPVLAPQLPHAAKVAALERLGSGPPARPLVKDSHRVRAAMINRTTNRRRTEFVDPGAIAVDFAYPLRALRKLGPGWHDWQPMPALLRSLLMAVLYLEDGFPLRPLAPGEKRPHEVAAEETEDRSATEPLVKFLLEKHPRTVHRLMRFRYRERIELGSYSFKEKYIWCR